MAQCGEPGGTGKNESAGQSPGFTQIDWISFAVTALVVLAVYVWTLAPEVTLGFCGIFSTAAMYGGVPHPPGYPLATLWEWFFIKLLPFGNIAWRVAISSAVASALACGLIALVVSRLGRGLLSNVDGMDTRQAAWLRIACGYVAGAVFGFNGAFWGRAVIADVWTLSILLFCIVLSLLLRWSYTPERKRYLYGACFAYGLTLTNSQILLAAAPAIPFLLIAASRDVARDMFVGGVIIFIAGIVDWLTPVWSRLFPLAEGNRGLFDLHFWIGAIITACAIALTIKTHKVLTQWKTILGCVALFVVGLLPYLYLPVASMTNPPMNWGYSRTTGGFWHVITRGQYEAIRPTSDLRIFGKQMQTYAQVSAAEFGWPYLLVAAIPLAFIRRLPRHERAWLLCSIPMFACLTLLMIAVLNPPDDRDARRVIKVFFSISYVVLAIWAGCGLIIVAQLFAKRRT